MKTLFNFSTKYKKADLAKFLVENGYDGRHNEILTDPIHQQYKIKDLLRSDKPKLEKLVKIYNANILGGGDGNYSEWYNDPSYYLYKKRDEQWNEIIKEKNIHPKIQSSKDYNEVSNAFTEDMWFTPSDRKSEEVIKKYRDYNLFKETNVSIFKSMQEKLDNYTNSLVGQFIGTEEELKGYMEIGTPIFIAWVDWLKEQQNFINFINKYFENK